MAYKDINNRKAASKRHYYANKEKYLERNKRYREGINQLVREIKEKTPCKACHQYYPYYVMDFDHVDAETKLNIVSFFAKTGRIGALKKEIEKCEIVCANCHRIRTFQRSEKVNTLRPRSSVD